MSARYHIGRDGQPRICRAQTADSCRANPPEGMKQTHGDKEVVAANAERQMRGESVKSLSKLSKGSYDSGVEKIDKGAWSYLRVPIGSFDSPHLARLSAIGQLIMSKNFGRPLTKSQRLSIDIIAHGLALYRGIEEDEMRVRMERTAEHIYRKKYASHK